MKINHLPIQNISQTAETQATRTKSPVQEQQKFALILNQKLEEDREIKLSKHAAMRLQARNINLSKDQVDRLKSAVSKASLKGVKDTLVVMDQMAFVVNVDARTVITAVNRNELKENIFTNIDGAVFT
ncbi:MAG TPA: flagellar biosynthesis protein [Ruminiclostridium sp.]|nr:flagellar biosynthesis protein [Ruminiclostridium sp.]